MVFSVIVHFAEWRYTGGRYLGDFYHYKDNKPITVIQE
jgi:hypothetical protein